MNEPPAKVQFDNLEQQHDASRLGMWLFLATEFLFFGVLFMAFAVHHLLHPQAFASAVKQTNLLCGSINAALLLTSGLTMALGVTAIQNGRSRACVNWVSLTLILGLVFLAVKGAEYAGDISKGLVPGRHFAMNGEPAAQIFFWLYWLMTGLHAIHLIVGIVMLAAIAWMTKQGRFSARYATPVELAGIYWGFVDLIWIFLYPLLYLIGRVK
ncbi:MAG TPA: cytochrome c oxidase subunit 3 [Verrucomicrobiae bacterium]|jgi:cytochrome c oxidase subunit 3